MSDGKIPKNKSINNLTNFQNVNYGITDCAKTNKMIQILSYLADKNLNYCPVCKLKNMPSEVYLAFDLIFCSKKCRHSLCNGIDIEELREFRNFKKIDSI